MEKHESKIEKRIKLSIKTIATYLVAIISNYLTI